MPHRIIGIICTSSGWGGLELNTLRLASWLREEGWKVHLLTAQGTPINQHAGDKPNTNSDFDRDKLPGKSGQLRIIHPWVRRYKIHIIFVPFNKDIAVASLYKRFYDNSIGLIYQQHMQVGVRKRDIIHTLRYAMLDYWIAPLQYLREETLQLTRVPAEKIKVIPFGLETDRFTSSSWSQSSARQALSLPQDAYIIGVLGRLDPKKGQDTVIKALKLLRANPGTNYHVLLMGDVTIHEGDAFNNSLHTLVKDTGLSDYVHFRPFAEDVLMFYRAINLFAMPSHGETFGMVTIEAMAAGVPVIGTNKDGTREILGEGKYGYLFQKESAEDFTQKVTALNTDPQLPQKLSAAKEEALTSYSKKQMIESLNELLLNLLAEVKSS